MKAILISIKPKWVAKILNGEKTLEIRKSAPKVLPCEVYIYCTKLVPYGCGCMYDEMARRYMTTFCNDGKELPNLTGRVVAKFVLKKITPIGKDMFGYCPFTSEILDGEWLGKGSCLTQNDLRRYLGDKMGYAWHIDDLVVFDKPKELKEFSKAGAPTYEQIKAILSDGYTMERHKKYLADLGYALTNAPQSWCYAEVEE